MANFNMSGQNVHNQFNVGDQKRIQQLAELVKEYQQLANTYHEDYPHPEDLQAIKDELEQRARTLGV